MFGGVFTVLFLIIALWPLVSGHQPRWWALIVSGIFLVVTAAMPALLTIPNRLWTRFGLLLNSIISPIALGILFFAVVTPMGYVMRALGKDFMRLRKDDQTKTYWVGREPPGPPPDSMSDQF